MFPYRGTCLHVGLRSANTAEQIEVLVRVEALGDCLAVFAKNSFVVCCMLMCSVYIVYMKLMRFLLLVLSLLQARRRMLLLVQRLISHCSAYLLTAKSRHIKWNPAVCYSSIFCIEIVFYDLYVTQHVC